MPAQRAAASGEPACRSRERTVPARSRAWCRRTSGVHDVPSSHRGAAKVLAQLCRGRRDAGVQRGIGPVYTAGSPGGRSGVRLPSVVIHSLPGGPVLPALSNVSGFPRIGAQRELKVATESYWSGERSRDDLLETARELRAANWKLQRDAGIDLIPSNDFSFYDQVLDTIALVGAVPERYEWDRVSRRRRPRHLLRDGARPPGRRRRRHRDGDDEVVRHQLPLHRPRAAARHGVPALLAQAVRRTTRRPRHSGSTPSRC